MSARIWTTRRADEEFLITEAKQELHDGPDRVGPVMRLLSRFHEKMRSDKRILFENSESLLFSLSQLQITSWLVIANEHG